MSITRELSRIVQVIKELRIPDDSLIRVDAFRDECHVQLVIESMAQVMDQFGRSVKKKKIEYIDGCLHVSFEARSIQWVACRRVDLATAERIQAAMGNRLELQSHTPRLTQSGGGS